MSPRARILASWAGLFLILACGPSRASEPTQTSDPLAQETSAGPPPTATPVAPATLWERLESQDALTQRPVVETVAQSREIIDLEFPYQGPQRARLSIREHPRHDTDIIFSLARGQIICRSRNCRVDTVFDDADPIRWRADPAEGGSSNTIFLRQHERFVRRLDNAREVRIAVTLYRQGTHVFTFPGRSEQVPTPAGRAE